MADSAKSITKLPRWAKIAMALLVAFVAAASMLLASRWPYTQARMVAAIENATRSRVAVQGFRSHLFPEPGCTLETVTIARDAAQPIAQVQSLRIRSSWLALLTFRKRIRLVQAQGLRVYIPSDLPAPVGSGGSGGLGEVVVGEFVADGATLEIARKDEEAARFAFHQLRLKAVGSREQTAYTAVLDLPDPPGRLRSSGTFGPLSTGDPARTPVAGSFELRDASLDKYKGLAGSIGAEGKFQGPLANVRVTGTAIASQFEVNRSGHPVEIKATYSAEVNGGTGDVVLETAEADFRATHLSVKGSVKGSGGKVVSMDFLGERARVEDLIAVFTRADRPAMEGPIHLRAHAELPPGEAPFLRKLILRGSFAINNARWAKPRTQMKVNSLSARARGDKQQVEDRTAADVDHVLSDLKGQVSLKGGLATLSAVSFHVPGATATGGGTYNLINKRVNLSGTVSMAADASEATSGFKSFLLKPFDKLFRRNKQKGASLPVSITGQYPRPDYKVGLTK